MKKEFNFNVNSERRCSECGRLLKMNLITKAPDAKKCYTCYKLASNNLNINRKRLAEKQRKYKLGAHV